MVQYEMQREHDLRMHTTTTSYAVGVVEKEHWIYMLQIGMQTFI
jgi:hypothetical protein